MDDARESANGYDAEILYMDSEFARLLEGLRRTPRWDETYVLLIGDHGEGLCQHGEAAHGGIWDEQLRVPMMLRAPGEAPREVRDAISSVDALPTLLGRTGREALRAFCGKSGGRDVLDPGFRPGPVFSEETGRLIGVETRRCTLTTDSWKYVHAEGTGGKNCLYDLRSDPFELHDIAAERPGLVDSMKIALHSSIEEQLARLRRSGRRTTAGAPVDSAVLEQLRSLGYVEK